MICHCCNVHVQTSVRGRIRQRRTFVARGKMRIADMHQHGLAAEREESRKPLPSCFRCGVFSCGLHKAGATRKRILRADGERDFGIYHTAIARALSKRPHSRWRQYARPRRRAPLGLQPMNKPCGVDIWLGSWVEKDERNNSQSSFSAMIMRRGRNETKAYLAVFVLQRLFQIREGPWPQGV